MHTPHIYIYICLTSHILWNNLQVYHIEGTVQQEKEHKFQGASRALGIVRQLNEFHTIPSQTLPHTLHTRYFQHCNSFLPKGISNNTISS